MKDLTLANEGKKQKALSRVYNFAGYGPTTFKKLIDSGEFVKAEIEETPKYKFNRTKYNRMDGYEQDLYDKKMKERKLVHVLYYGDGCCVDCPKMVYEYFYDRS